MIDARLTDIALDLAEPETAPRWLQCSINSRACYDRRLTEPPELSYAARSQSRDSRRLRVVASLIIVSPIRRGVESLARIEISKHNAWSLAELVTGLGLQYVQELG